MTPFQKRLAQAIDTSGRSARAVSIDAGLSPGTVSELLRQNARSPSVENLRALAIALGTSFAWLADGTSDNQRADGFSESDVQPWHADAQDPGDATGNLTDEDVLRIIAPAARHAALFMAHSTATALGVCSGDLLAVDLGSTARDGDLVLATTTNLQTGEARTLLRRLLTPYLVSGNPLDDTTPTIVDGHRTAVLGVVLGLVRRPRHRG